MYFDSGTVVDCRQGKRLLWKIQIRDLLSLKKSLKGNSGRYDLANCFIRGGVWLLQILFFFGEGVKGGQRNYFVKKGYMFKTNEGRLIQTGIRSQAPGNIASNEFMFSVTDEKVAEQLNKSAGSNIEVHYKEYISPLPWRGVTVFVVDSLISTAPGNGVNTQN